MNPLFIALRLAIGWGLGASPGIVMMLTGEGQQGLGFAILGGSLGFILALSGVLYKTDSTTTLLRGLLLFGKMTAAKNIPLGDKLFPEPKELEGQFAQTADLETLDARMYVGLRVGCVVAIAPAIWIALNISNRTQEPLVIEILKRCVIGFSFVAFVGGVCGMAVGGLTVPGVHQRNILLGPLLGSLIGLGFGTVLAQNAVDPRILVSGCIGTFAFLGLIGGALSAENFHRPAGVESSPSETEDLPPR